MARLTIAELKQGTRRRHTVDIDGLGEIIMEELSIEELAELQTDESTPEQDNATGYAMLARCVVLADADGNDVRVDPAEAEEIFNKLGPSAVGEIMAAFRRVHTIGGQGVEKATENFS